ncbi:MAG: hypothetical protein ACMUIP_01820 [bacterium]
MFISKRCKKIVKATLFVLLVWFFVAMGLHCEKKWVEKVAYLVYIRHEKIARKFFLEKNECDRI